MPSYLGQALMGIGAGLPGTIRSNREMARETSLDPLRAALLRSQVGKAGLEFETAQRQQEAEDEARRRVDEAINLYLGKPELEMPEYKRSEFEPTARLPRKLSEQRLQMPGDLMKKYELPEKMKPTPKLGAANLEEALFKSGSLEYADQPVVKNIMDIVRTKEVSGRSKWAQQQGVGGPEDEAAANARINELVSSGKLTPGQESVFRQMASRNAVALNEILSKRDVSIEGAVRQFEELAPKQISLAAGKTQAQQTVKARGEKPTTQKDDEFIVNTRSAYDDISAARSLFKPEFAKPYIGKVFKISTMKQLSPEFNDFLSSLEKGVSKYRKENFGTALTAGELMNLKDIIDKDMAVKPEVLITQIDKFMSTAKRDYDDRLKLMKKQGKYIPEGYGTIGVSGGESERVKKKKSGSIFDDLWSAGGGK